MYLKYGNYQHDVADAAVVIRRETVRNDQQQPVGLKEIWDIQGKLQADTQAELTTAITALKNAYLVQYRDIGLYLDDGTPTSHLILNRNTTSGVIVTAGPSFPEGSGAEYSTFRTYSITVEAELKATDLPDLLTWQEVLSFQGGGPRKLFLQPLTGPPQEQIVAQQTPFRATQTGSAVGRLRYPNPANPLWPAAEHRDQRQVTRRGPKQSLTPGRPLSYEFTVEWSYQFESVAPLTGNPTLG